MVLVPKLLPKSSTIPIEFSAKASPCVILLNRAKFSVPFRPCAYKNEYNPITQTNSEVVLGIFRGKTLHVGSDKVFSEIFCRVLFLYDTARIYIRFFARKYAFS